jgi:hypothetical protein
MSVDKMEVQLHSFSGSTLDVVSRRGSKEKITSLTGCRTRITQTAVSGLHGILGLALKWEENMVLRYAFSVNRVVSSYICYRACKEREQEKNDECVCELVLDVCVCVCVCDIKQSDQ